MNEENEHASDNGLLLEALRHNWENARYHESTRWKYVYYYYAAFGAALIYSYEKFLEFDINTFFDSFKGSGTFAILSFFLILVGFASFQHLVHANMEYKNHIRAIEFIARDLGLNMGITEFRIAREKKEETGQIERCTYLALPLLLKIRAGVGFWKITALTIALSVSTFVFFAFTPISYLLPISSLKQAWLICVIILAIIAPARSYSFCKQFWNDKENEAEAELHKRDPRRKWAKRPC